MASTLKINTLTGVTTAGSIAVTAEGNSTTTNLQQGLAKQWFNNSAGSSPRDSLNVSSITDNQTGDDSYALTNNMANDDYASITAGWRDHDAYHACAENLISTSANRCRSFTRGGSTLVDSGYKAVAVHGDLA